MSLNKRLLLGLFCILSFPFSMAKSLNLSIELSFPLAIQHQVHVLMEFEQTTSKPCEISMPVWTPGSYLVREFAKSVETVQWSENGTDWHRARKINKSTWSIPAKKGSRVRVQYDVYAREMSVRTSYVDADQGLLNMASLVMFLGHAQQAEGKLTLHLPQSWSRSSTSLKPSGEGQHSYHFSSYDELVDSPVQVGNHEEFSFEVRGIRHRVAMVGPHQANIDTLRRDMQRICETMTGVVGEHPCTEYLFIVQHVAQGGGGLEHANSSCLMMQGNGYENPDRYQRFLGLVAHEYFHLWNVKRIRPIELGPFDYLNENYTDLLWVAEGITSYYDELALLRAGYVDAAAFLNTLAQYIDAVENRPGSSVHSLAEVSRDAWIREYRPNENSANTSVSYYSKGLVVAAYLDAEIRGVSQGRADLDSLMRYLYQRYYKELKRGFTPAEFTEATARISGSDLSHWNSFFDYCLYGLEPVSKKYSFQSVGVEQTSAFIPDPSLGAGFAKGSAPLEVTSIKRGSTAFYLGLNVGDKVTGLEFNGQLWEGENLLSHWQSPELQAAEQSISVHIERQGMTRILQGKTQGDQLQKTTLRLPESWKSNPQSQAWLRTL